MDNEELVTLFIKLTNNVVEVCRCCSRIKTKLRRAETATDSIRIHVRVDSIQLGCFDLGKSVVGKGGSWRRKLKQKVVNNSMR